jgi:hypothetical protein
MTGDELIALLEAAAEAAPTYVSTDYLRKAIDALAAANKRAREAHRFGYYAYAGPANASQAEWEARLEEESWQEFAALKESKP